MKYRAIHTLVSVLVSLLVALGCQRDRNLSKEEIANIRGSAKLQRPADYEMRLYNGNKDIVITELIIRLTTRSGDDSESRDYDIDLHRFDHIHPMTAGSFEFEILPGDSEAEYSWEITGARGR